MNQQHPSWFYFFFCLVNLRC